MIKSKNEKLFKLIMDDKFETGEYNFETPYGSVKLVKAWPICSSKCSIDKVDLYLDNELILTLKNCNSWFDPFTYEILYAHDGERKIELRAEPRKEGNSLTMTVNSPISDFLIMESKHNEFLAIKDDDSLRRFEAQLSDNELCGENINYHLEDETEDFLVHIDDNSAVAVPISPNSTAAQEIAELKDKLAETKKSDTHGLLLEAIFKKWEFDKNFDVENLDMEEKALKAIAEFYNTYRVNKEEIFERLDSNPVFKEVEKYVERIFQEQELAAAQEKVNEIKKRIRELEN